MGCCTHLARHTYVGTCLHRHPFVNANAVIPTAVFHLENGKTVSFDNVNVDSIGPSAESPGVIGVEFDDNADRIVHIPFVRYWEIEYR